VPNISLEEIRAWLKEQLPGASAAVDSLPDEALYAIFALLALGVLATAWTGVEWLLKRLGVIKDEAKQARAAANQATDAVKKLQRELADEKARAEERYQKLLAAIQAGQAAAEQQGRGAGAVLEAGREARALAETEDPVLVAARDKIAQRDFDGARDGLAKALAQSAASEAERWRTLGFLESLRSVSAAIAAYEKAAALAPTDFWTAVQLGRLHRAAGNLAAGRKLALAALEQAKTPRDRSVALNELGDVARREGDLPAARKAYEDSLAIRKDLRARDPQNSEWARDLSVSYNKLGDVARREGDLPAARKAYEDSLAIAKDLRARDPQNSEWARDLWVTMWRLADLGDAGVSWGQVCDAMEDMHRRGVLLPTDADFLAQARAKAGRG
jgi:hypothetical protein